MLAIALAVAPTFAFAADDIDVPDVPANLVVPDDNEVFLVGHAVGTQNYVCLPTAVGYAWTFFGPQASATPPPAIGDGTRRQCPIF